MPRPPAGTDDGAAVRQRTVLIAEDAADERDALRAALELEGYRVMAVPNGREALHFLTALDERPPDVVIMDLNMPLMDGFAFHRARGKHPHLMDVPVIALTGHAALRRHALAMGFTAALQKPCDFDMLLSLGCRPESS